MGNGSEPQVAATNSVSWFRLVRDQACVTPEVENWQYEGSGTEEDPYVVVWIDKDPRNPMLLAQWQKWGLTMLVSIATLAVAFVSSAYTGGIDGILTQFHTSDEVVTLGVSLFVLGFALGPLLWAPFSEIFGRQILFIGTYAALTAFNAGCAGSQNIWTLIILRFFAGTFGSSPLTVGSPLNQNYTKYANARHNRTLVESLQICSMLISVDLPPHSLQLLHSWVLL